MLKIKNLTKVYGDKKAWRRTGNAACQWGEPGTAAAYNIYERHPKKNPLENSYIQINIRRYRTPK